MNRLTILAAALAASVSHTAFAETADEAAARFGALQDISAISLSPTGDKVAYIAPYGAHGQRVMVAKLGSGGSPASMLANEATDLRITGCDWATDIKLVCRAYTIAREGDGTLIGLTRLLSVDTADSKVEALTKQTNSRSLGYNQHGGTVLALDVEGKDDTILMTREWLREVTVGRLAANDKNEGLGVEEVDLATKRTKMVEKPTADTFRYIADENGLVRVMMRHPRTNSGQLGDKQFYFYRQRGSKEWKPLDTSSMTASYDGSFYPVAVDSAKDVVYGFQAENGYDGLYSMALDGSGRRSKLLARDDVDVDTLVRIGRRNRVVGASYATEKRAVVYTDPELAALVESLHKALPGTPLIDIVDASRDEGKLLLVASSDTNAGMTYLYDKSNRQLAPLLPIRGNLDGQAMGKMAPVTFPATDGTSIPAYLTLPPGVSDPKGLPAIVMPHGGPSARDEWGFDWLVQFFATQGYVVLQPNYRGSAGYGSAWFGRNGFKAWETAVGDVNAAGRWLVSEGMADPAKLAIVGWSYGGYAALQSQVLDPQLYKAVVAVAPVADLGRLKDESRGFTNHALVSDEIGSGDHIRTGSPAQNADRFAAPVLLFHGTIDQNVGVGQSRLMKSKLESAGKRVEYTEFKDLDHGLVSSEARTRMLTQTAGFLRQALGR